MTSAFPLLKSHHIRSSTILGLPWGKKAQAMNNRRRLLPTLITTTDHRGSPAMFQTQAALSGRQVNQLPPCSPGTVTVFALTVPYISQANPDSWSPCLLDSDLSLCSPGSLGWVIQLLPPESLGWKRAFITSKTNLLISQRLTLCSISHLQSCPATRSDRAHQRLYNEPN